MSITELPPLPKSLSDFNRLQVSESGLASDNDPKVDQNCNKLGDPNDSTINAALSDHRLDNKNNNINNDSGIDNTPSQLSLECDNAANQTTRPPLVASNQALFTSSTLDKQLATLKKEMYGLRQLDLSLLSQLWALNDSIQEFRTILQEQEDDESYSQHSPSPSSYDSVSSDGEDEVIKAKPKILGARPKIIKTQPKLLINSKTSKMNEQQQTNNQRLKITSHLNSSHIDEVNTLNVSQKPPASLPKPHILPRMRSAPPPPPPVIKIQSSTRPHT